MLRTLFIIFVVSMSLSAPSFADSPGPDAEAERALDNMVQRIMEQAREVGDVGAAGPASPKLSCSEPLPEPRPPRGRKPTKPAPAKACDETYLKASPMVQSDDPEIIAVAKAITARFKDALAKSRAIHQWVALNVTYNREVANKRWTRQDEDSRQDALSVLRSRDAVCEGYANLVAALHRAVGLPSKVVTGKYVYVSRKNFELLSRTGHQLDLDKSTLHHAWNEVQIDGKWLPSDPTLDSMVGGGSELSPAEAGRLEFFNAPADYFAATHKKTGEMDH